MSCTKSKKNRLATWRTYAILDGDILPSKISLENAAGKLSESLIDVVQLRFREYEYMRFFPLFKGIVRKMKSSGKAVIVNDRPEIAHILGADGVHLGKEDVPVLAVRALLGVNSIIGKTIRCVEDLKRAFREGSDYVAVGPCFKTPVKKDLQPISLDVLRMVQQSSRLPIFAVGGIDSCTLDKVIGCGFKRVASARHFTVGDVVENVMATCLKFDKEMRD